MQDTSQLDVSQNASFVENVFEYANKSQIMKQNHFSRNDHDRSASPSSPQTFQVPPTPQLG